MIFAYSICFSVRFFGLLSASSFARMSTLLSGVRSSCDMLARNSDLYLLVASSSFPFSCAIFFNEFGIDLPQFFFLCFQFFFGSLQFLGLAGKLFVGLAQFFLLVQ